MEYFEAIEILEETINETDKLCRCKLCEASRLAIMALKHMTPTIVAQREHFLKDYGNYPVTITMCPNCNMAIRTPASSGYCERCGQALLWSIP